MKKFYATLIAVIAIAQLSYAQWTPSGSNIYYNSGKASIGTTSFFSGLTVQQSATDFNGVVLQAFGNDRWLRLGTDGTVGVVEATYNSTAGSMPLVFKSGEAERMRVTTNGYIGIGTISPGSMLEVAGTITTKSSSVDGINNRIWNMQTGNSLAIYSTGTTAYGVPGWSDAGVVEHDKNIVIDGYTGSVSIGTARNLSIYVTPSTYGTPGNVGIGTTDPQGYKLAVNGSAIAESVTVKLHGSWPDFVFKPTYNLPDLKDVKAYIDKNQHLPDMPSEQEVTKNGINLGEIVKTQTKKIEELTLYLIDKDKQLSDQQKKADQQDARIAALEKAMSKLANK